MRVVETFETIQGEGYWAGTPSFFIRLGGCTVPCPIRKVCDTDFDTWTERTEESLIEEAKPHRVVVITGGEPLQQDLDSLTYRLLQAGKRVHLETSGSLPCTARFTWVTVSPKVPVQFVKPAKINEVKLVYRGQSEDEIRSYEALVAEHYFLQPLWNTNTDETVETVMRLSWPWRLSLQTHKWIGVP